MPITNAQPANALPTGGLRFSHVNPMHVYLFKPGAGNWQVGPVGPEGEIGIVPNLITLVVEPGLMGQVTDPTGKNNPERVYGPAIGAYTAQGHVFIDPKDPRTTVQPAHRGEKDGRTSPYAVAYDGTHKGADARCYTHACAVLDENQDGTVTVSEVPWQFNRWALSLVERGVIPGPTDRELDAMAGNAAALMERANARAIKSPQDVRQSVTRVAHTHLSAVQAAVEQMRATAPTRRRKLPEHTAA